VCRRGRVGLGLGLGLGTWVWVINIVLLIWYVSRPGQLLGVPRFVHVQPGRLNGITMAIQLLQTYVTNSLTLETIRPAATLCLHTLTSDPSTVADDDPLTSLTACSELLI
jgi:hypothetical protein